MVLSASDAADLVGLYKPDLDKSMAHVDWVDRWARGDLKDSDKPYIAHDENREHRELRDRSMTRWLSLVVTASAQSLYVEGYRRSDSEENAAVWGVWQANRLDSRQGAFHRDALAHGSSYSVILPGRNLPRIEGYSARHMAAWYDDPANDEWPIYALRHGDTLQRDGSRVERMFLYDAEAIYTFDVVAGRGPVHLSTDAHGVGECPVVRFDNMLDLSGRSWGEVEPYIAIASRIDQDTFDRLVVQRYGAFLLRWIAGLDSPETTEDRAALLKMLASDIMIFEDEDTKTGAFPATPLDGYIKARDSDIRDLAAVTQTPPQYLLGQMVNLSAEALAAAEAGLTRKVEERKHSFGEAWEQVLRTAAGLMGDDEGANDLSAQVRWRNMESRSLAQVADALTKLGQAGVPIQLLAEKYMPDWTEQDVTRLQTILEDGDALGQLLAQIGSDFEPAV